MVADARTLAREGIGFVAISANDIVSHPEDSPAKMKTFAETHGFPVSLSLRREPGDRASL